MKCLSLSKSFKTPIAIPCNICYACRTNRVTKWVTKMLFETLVPERGTPFFLTLTYDEDHLPDNYSISKDEFQRFKKRFYKHLKTHYPDRNFSFFAVGEYGSRTMRPHYHAIIWGFSPEDTFLHNLLVSSWKLSAPERIDVRFIGLEDALKSKGDKSISNSMIKSFRYTMKYALKNTLTGNTPLNEEDLGEQHKYISEAINSPSEYKHFCKKFFNTTPEGLEPEFSSKTRGLGFDGLDIYADYLRSNKRFAIGFKDLKLRFLADLLTNSLRVDWYNNYLRVNISLPPEFDYIRTKYASWSIVNKSVVFSPEAELVNITHDSDVSSFLDKGYFIGSLDTPMYNRLTKLITPDLLSAVEALDNSNFLFDSDVKKCFRLFESDIARTMLEGYNTFNGNVNFGIDVPITETRDYALAKMSMKFRRMPHDHEAKL